MNYAPSWRGQAEHRLRLIRELKRRECRRSFLAFCIEALKPLGLSPAPHHRLLINELEQIARGENDRLLINMPPGSAKSTYASVRADVAIIDDPVKSREDADSEK